MSMTTYFVRSYQKQCLMSDEAPLRDIHPIPSVHCPLIAWWYIHLRWVFLSEKVPDFTSFERAIGLGNLTS